MVDYYGNKITWIPVLEKANKPLYILIAESIERDIKCGKLKSSFKLPAQRIIAGYLGINHSTVTRAYKLCEEKRLIKGVIGKGTFVCSTAGIPTDLLTNHRDKNVIEMGTGHPLYEVNGLIKSIVSELYSFMDYDLILKYTPPEGHIKHRYIASKYLQQHKIESTVDNILITSGSQNALAVILISLFRKGDRIIVDELSYTGLNNLAKLIGIILISVKGDKSGIDIPELKTTCKRENIKGIYLMPDCHNPTSVVMDVGKREAVSKIIDRYNLILIEDGTFSFCLEKKIKPISSIIPNNGIYIYGTSKALNPTFRISYIVSPGKYLKQLKHSIQALTWMASPFTSEIVSLLQSSSKYDEIVKAKLKILKERNLITDKILKEFDLWPSKTSMFRYLSLPKEFDDAVIENLCLKSGIQVFSSKRFSTGMKNDQNAIRISIGGPQNKQELIRGLKILKNILLS